jgi:hypothetical protein
MARSTSTATTATPAALSTAPVSAPIPVGVEQFPEHWIRTRATPMSNPHSPATTMVAKAMARAFTGGSAVGPVAGSLGPVPGGLVSGGPAPVSGTGRS